jgi:hypothetical protein
MAYDLKALRETADKACDAAFNANLDCCVNWGDFACVGAEHWVDDEGNEGYRVCIEEADPNNREMGEFITEHLVQAGYEGVEVVFEW